MPIAPPDTSGEGERLAAALLENTTDCIKVLDLDGRLLALNGPGLCAMDIDNFEALRGEAWADLWPDAARSSIESSITAARRGETVRFIADCPTAKGVPKKWEVTVAPVLSADGSVDRLLAISKDVTASVRRSEARSVLAQEAGGVGTFEMNLSEQVLRGSPVFFGLYGEPANSAGIPHERWLQHLHPEDREPHLRSFEAALETEGTLSSEYRLLRDGEVRWISSRIRIERDEHGRPVNVLGVQQDITDMKRSESLWRTLLASIPDGLVVSNEKGTITSASDTACRLFGYTREELVGRNLSILMPAVHASRHDKVLERYRETGERRVIGKTNLLTPKRKDGSGFPAEISIGEALLGEERTFFGFVRDISERHAAETKLGAVQAEFAKSARLAAMGQIAASIAHELNQPLASISNGCAAAARLVTSGKTNDPLLGELLDDVRAQTARAGEIIRALRSFVSRAPARRASFVLSDVVGEAATLATMDGRATGVMLSIECPATIVVAADRAQIQLLIFNLVRNAFDAVSGSSLKEISITARAGPDVATVEVADSGVGLPGDPEFDPFELFASTKPEGMGVGLSLCQTIAEANGGKIWCTRRTRGTAFHFTLPLEDRSG